MEWVETTADTLEAAKNLALDQLGVSEEDAEFDVLEEPKPGLFGRTRGEARVRARVRPTAPRSKPERRDRGQNAQLAQKVMHQKVAADQNRQPGQIDHAASHEKRRMLSAHHVQKALQ